MIRLLRYAIVIQCSLRLNLMAINVKRISLRKAIAIAQQCTHGAQSVNEIAKRLSNNGFKGCLAIISVCEIIPINRDHPKRFVFTVKIHCLDNKQFSILVGQPPQKNRFPWW